MDASQPRPRREVDIGAVNEDASAAGDVKRFDRRGVRTVEDEQLAGPHDRAQSAPGETFVIPGKGAADYLAGGVRERVRLGRGRPDAAGFRQTLDDSCDLGIADPDPKMTSES